MAIAYSYGGLYVDWDVLLSDADKFLTIVGDLEATCCVLIQDRFTIEPTFPCTYDNSVFYMRKGNPLALDFLSQVQQNYLSTPLADSPFVTGPLALTSFLNSRPDYKNSCRSMIRSISMRSTIRASWLDQNAASTATSWRVIVSPVAPRPSICGRTRGSRSADGLNGWSIRSFNVQEGNWCTVKVGVTPNVVITTSPTIIARLRDREFFRERYWERNDPIVDDRLLWRAQTFRHLVHLLPGQSVLELGCGRGRFTKQLVRVSRGASPIMAVTFSSAERPADFPECAEHIASTNFPAELIDRRFDYVVAMDLLDRELAPWMLDTIYHLLSPSGQVVFYESNPGTSFSKPAVRWVGCWVATTAAPC